MARPLRAEAHGDFSPREIQLRQGVTAEGSFCPLDQTGRRSCQGDLGAQKLQSVCGSLGQKAAVLD